MTNPTPNASVEEIAIAMVPSWCSWSTGTGTKQSHAQIISPHRRHSFYATAKDEGAALRLAAAEAHDWHREKGIPVVRIEDGLRLRQHLLEQEQSR